MGEFSDDGRWWWDGKTWVATSQVVLPQLPPTELEQSGDLDAARRRLRNRGWLYWLNDINLAWLTLPFLLPTLDALRAYRLWTIQQLTLATAFILGSDEPIIAAEVNLNPPNYVGDSFERDPAVVVTQQHVVVVRIDSFDGQPRWIAMAARTSEVKIESRWIWEGGILGPALIITTADGRWVIRALLGVSMPKPVVDAWRQAARGAIRTG